MHPSSPAVQTKDKTMPTTKTRRLSKKPYNNREKQQDKPQQTLTAAKRAKAVKRSSSASSPSHGSVLKRLRPVLSRAGVELIQGDSRLEMAKMEANSIDAIITDPPYGLTDGLDTAKLLSHWMSGTAHEGSKAGFMGKSWDSCVPSPALWREALRVLKPGGHCLAFGGSRTAHLTQTSMELAGFEVRDTLIWHYSTGMPKSHSLGHKLGHDSDSAVGTALAPSQESIIVARKPLEHGLTNAANALKWGTAGINIGATMIGSAQMSADGPAGRWPKNTILSHSAECRLIGTDEVACSAHSPAQRTTGFGKFGGGKVVLCGDDHRPGHEQVEKWECAPSCPVAALDAQRGNRPSRYFQTFSEDEPPLEEQVASMGELPLMRVLRHEQPKFLYVPKPSPAERHAGLTGGEFRARRGHRLSYGPRKDVAIERLNVHPTVKPIDIMRWLIDLACPEGGTVLDPFNGSGSTGCAAVLSSRPYVGIELDDTEGYLDITAARISYWAEKAKEEHAGTGKVVRLSSPSERARVKKAVVKKPVVKKAA
jgi:site-specific DNA-methyltransferase (adenine-specific)